MNIKTEQRLADVLVTLSHCRAALDGLAVNVVGAHMTSSDPANSEYSHINSARTYVENAIYDIQRVLK